MDFRLLNRTFARNNREMKRFLAYLFIFTYTLLALVIFPKVQSYVAYPQLIYPATALLFVLLIVLSVRLIGWQDKAIGILTTGLFIGLFFPSSEAFFGLNWNSLHELGSQCIVPFFMGQYNRIRDTQFTRNYMIMLLMGIFCSYTHDGITIPLCAGFIWMSILHRDKFFRTACWPMVIGFVIGTSISIWKANNIGFFTQNNYFSTLSTHTAESLGILWDTKIFLLAIGITIYLGMYHWGRTLILQSFREHPLLAHCAIFSLCTMPFAPLGLDNAVKGVCFFCMFWTLILGKSLINKYIQIKTFRTTNLQETKNI